MKRNLIFLTALLIGAASAAPRGERIDKSFTPFWIADQESLTYRGAGAPMNWAAWTDVKYGAAGRRVIPSGTAISIVNGKIEPATGAVETVILVSNANEFSPSDSVSGYGVVQGGSIYEAQLPDATGAPRVLPAAIKTKLPPTIRLQ